MQIQKLALSVGGSKSALHCLPDLEHASAHDSPCSATILIELYLMLATDTSLESADDNLCRSIALRRESIENHGANLLTAIEAL